MATVVTFFASQSTSVMRNSSRTLVGAILRPVNPCRTQTRPSSTGHNVTLLDKLHRKQKQAIREERLASIQRARSNPALTTSSPIATGSTISPPSPTSASEASQPASQQLPPPAASPSLPYTITRTRPGHQLPIYNLSKGGGTKHITKIRKLSGDLNALKADLTKALGLEGGMTNRRGEKVEGASVNWQTNQIIVRGWRGPEIKAWAESRGF